MDISEQELIVKAVEGDQVALTELLKRHGPAVRQSMCGSIPRRWRSVLSLDDVMQQAYTAAFCGIGGFVPRGEGAFGAWLATLAKRTLIDAIRGLEADKRGGDRKRIEIGSTDESFVALFERLGGTATTPSRQAARHEARACLEQAIAALPEAYRTLVRLYDLEGKSAREVAIALGRSPGAVYMLRARAHQRLSEIMGTASRYVTDWP